MINLHFGWVPWKSAHKVCLNSCTYMNRDMVISKGPFQRFSVELMGNELRDDGTEKPAWPQRVLPWGSGNAVSRNWCCLNRSARKKQEWGKAGWRWSLDKILGCADTGREGQNQRDGTKTRFGKPSPQCPLAWIWHLGWSKVWRQDLWSSSPENETTIERWWFKRTLSFECTLSRYEH